MSHILKQSDPYKILNISTPTTDKKEIKRAFRRMAVKYHPDVVSDPKDKELANEVFAKINGAYELLSGKGGGGGAYQQQQRAASSGGGYTPPHRRTGPYQRKTYDSSGFDWDEYMANQRKEDDAKYDVGDDSFEKIFTDLFSGVAAGGAAGGRGILRDLVEFLESNVEGFSTNYDSDPTLEMLLQTGSLSDIKEEMDDTSLLLQQLQVKDEDLKKEIAAVQSMEDTGSYLKTLEKEERLAEMNARKGVVDSYILKATKRLTRLQLRYKELRGTRTTSTDSTGSGGTTSYTSSTRTSYQQPQQQQQPQQRPSSSDTSTTASSKTDDWKHSGFGSSGRGRGRSRARSSASSSTTPTPTASTPTPSPQSYSTSPSASPQRQTSSTTPRTTPPSSSSVTPQTTSEEWVPPHRRAKSYADQAAQDKKRIRELQVDEEFEKLKRDLGM